MRREPLACVMRPAAPRYHAGQHKVSGYRTFRRRSRLNWRPYLRPKTSPRISAARVRRDFGKRDLFESYAIGLREAARRGDRIRSMDLVDVGALLRGHRASIPYRGSRCPGGAAVSALRPLRPHQERAIAELRRSLASAKAPDAANAHRCGQDAYERLTSFGGALDKRKARRLLRAALSP